MYCFVLKMHCLFFQCAKLIFRVQYALCGFKVCIVQSAVFGEQAVFVVQDLVCSEKCPLFSLHLVVCSVLYTFFVCIVSGNCFFLLEVENCIILKIGVEHSLTDSR